MNHCHPRLLSVLLLRLMLYFYMTLWKVNLIKCKMIPKKKKREKVKYVKENSKIPSSFGLLKESYVGFKPEKPWMPIQSHFKVVNKGFVLPPSQ